MKNNYCLLVAVAAIALSSCTRQPHTQTKTQTKTQTSAGVGTQDTQLETLKEDIEASSEDLGKITIDPAPLEITPQEKIEIEKLIAEDPKPQPQPAPKPVVDLPKIPERAYALMPEVNKAIDDIWPDMPMRSYFPAQIEAESCITLTHSKCWNPKAELKTSREYGFGLGQLTVAYNANGTERFNVFNEVKQRHPDLKNWAWEDRYNPLLQIKAIVVKNKVNWGAIKWETYDLDNKMAFLATYYNGGSPLRDRKLCVDIAGCDPTKWWGNVELYSIKSKTKLKEYGNRSLFEISREYPRKVLIDRRPKYVPYTGT